MVEPALKQRADERFASALEATGAKDPREYYRDWLRDLRGRSAGAYAKAVDYYENRLLPRVAEEGSDPVAEWLEYGRVLAELTAPGKLTQIDPTGRSLPYSPPVPLDHLVLHLPTSSKDRVLLVGRPARLSRAQRATYDLLVKGSLG